MHSLLAAPKPYVRSSESPYIREDNTHLEFSSVLPYCRGLGLDIGCGGNRLSETVLSIDSYDHPDADMKWDILSDGKYPFKSGRFDFVFASHVIEDFDPDKIQFVFNEWMRLIKNDGHLCLLVPDMENGRYPDVNDKWTEEDDLVKSGDRMAGDCRGNNSHKITMGATALMKLVRNYPGVAVIVQSNTLPRDQMTMDFVVKKLR